MRNAMEPMNNHKRKLEDKIASLEDLVLTLTNRVQQLEHNAASWAIRLNQNEKLSNDFILKSHRYQDLSPEQAFDFYIDKNKNFVVVDVSKEGFKPVADLPEAMKFDLNQLEMILSSVPNKATGILVICENGVNSILACEKLSKLGYLNLNNVSGGYKYWIGHNNLNQLKIVKTA